MTASRRCDAETEKMRKGQTSIIHSSRWRRNTQSSTDIDSHTDAQTHRHTDTDRHTDTTTKKYSGDETSST